MVEYVGTTKTCRLWDSPYHVSNVCRKLAHKVDPVSIPKNQLGSTRSYRQVITNPHKKLGWLLVAEPGRLANTLPLRNVFRSTAVAQVSEIFNQALKPMKALCPIPAEAELLALKSSLPNQLQMIARKNKGRGSNPLPKHRETTKSSLAEKSAGEAKGQARRKRGGTNRARRQSSQRRLALLPGSKRKRRNA